MDLMQLRAMAKINLGLDAVSYTHLMFLASQEIKNPLASELASDF